MALHNVGPQIFYSGAWTVVTPDVFTGNKIKITQGFTESGEVRPSKIEWTFNDAAGVYDPTVPTSPLYGVVGRNTRAAVSVDGSIRSVCEIASYAPDQTEEFTVPGGKGMRWVDMISEGPLRRIGAWSDPLRDPMYRQVTQYGNLLGYWPVTDPSTATALSNGMPGGKPGSVDPGTQLAGLDGPGGSSDVAKLNASSSMAGQFKSAPINAGWQVCWSVPPLAANLTAAILPIIKWTCTNGYQWTISMSNGAYLIDATDNLGAAVVTLAIGYGTGAEPTRWIQHRVKVSISGTTVSWVYGWNPQGVNVLYQQSGTFTANNTGSPASWRVDGNANLVNGSVAHIFALTTAVDDLQSYNANRAFDGYAGETAGARFQRLCAEEGIFQNMIGTAATTWPMGVQRADSFINLVKECAETDGALLFDRVDNIGVTFRTRRSLTGQAVKLALNWPADIAPPMPKVIDDLLTANRVTVAQRDGGDATLSLDVGPMSTQQQPAGVGTYKKTVDVNVADETTLPALAGWWLARGTIEGARWPTIVLDLDGTPALTTAANAVGIGDRITVTGRTPDVVDLLVIGIYEEVETRRRRLTFTCVPFTVFDTGAYDSTAKRYDNSGSLTVGTMTTTVGTLIAGPGSAKWGTQTPYDILVAGERMTVTSIFASGANQGLNVVRSVNGVIKAHVAGEEVRVAAPARYGL